MKKQTIKIILVSFLIVFLFVLAFVYFYNKDEEIEFYGTVKEAYSSYALVIPFLNEKLSESYEIIDVPIANLKAGDVIKIKCQKTFLETYPPAVTVNSYKIITLANQSTTTSTESLTTTLMTTTTARKIITKQITESNPKEEIKSPDDNVINSITNDINTVSATSSKASAKSIFIKVVDFIFYDGSINGYYFKDLTNKAKLKVVSLTLKLDNLIDNKFPGYKEELSSKYRNAKNNLITFYLNKTTEFCQNNDAVCTEAKNDFALMKKSLNISWDVIKNIANESVTKLKEWYEIYSGK